MSDAENDAPIVHDFWEGVRAEKAHQVKRWGTTQDRNKTPADWFWLVGYLAGKALASAVKGDREKALHHCISSAAVLAHWHDSLGGAGDSLKVEHDPSRASDLETHLGIEPETESSSQENMKVGTKVAAIERALRSYGAECSRGNEYDNRERIKAAEDLVWLAIWDALKVIADRKAALTKGVS